MAQFYASIQGNRGEATRMGTKSSGIEGHIRGWDVGVKVIIRHDEATKQDVATVYVTSGSNGHSQSSHVGTFTTDNERGEPIEI